MWSFNLPYSLLIHGVTAPVIDMDELSKRFRQSFEDIYVLAVEIGDRFDNWLLSPMNRQVKLFCRTDQDDVKLREYFNMIGVSQGSFIVRKTVEQCSVPIYILATSAGIHRSAFGIPDLQLLPSSICELSLVISVIHI